MIWYVRAIAATLFGLFMVAALLPGLCRAAESTPPAGRETASVIRPSGAQAMVASAAYPGLGQLLNGAELKATVLGVAEVALATGWLLEDRSARNSLRLYKQTGRADYFEDYSKHFDRRQSLIWWTIFAALYSVADAYVDAHLTAVDSSLYGMPGPALLDETPGLPGPVSLCLSIRF